MKAEQAVILAGGRGTRLWPLTVWYPKPLIKIHRFPLISYSIAMLKRAGIYKIFIAVHHRADYLVQQLGDGKEMGVQLKYIFEPTLLGSGGALKNLQPFLGDQPIVVINSDTIMDLDIERTLNWHKSKGADATMVTRKKPESSSFSPVAIDSKSSLISIRSLPSEIYKKDIKIKMFAGVQVLTEIIFNYLPEGYSDIVSAFWQPALKDGLNLQVYDYVGPWWEVGTPRQLIAALIKSTPKDFPALLSISTQFSSKGEN